MITTKQISTDEIDAIRKELKGFEKIKDVFFGDKLDIAGLSKDSNAWRIFINPKYDIVKKFSEFTKYVNGFYKDLQDKEIALLNGCPAKYWGRSSRTGESGNNWWVFPASMTDTEIETYLSETVGIELEGRGINSPYDCTGKTFFHTAEIIRRKNRVLVKQGWGIDI